MAKRFGLNLVGGGIKGVMQVQILSAIEDITNRRICDTFDIISGTSIGAINSLALTLKEPYLAKNLIGLFVNESDTIFNNSALSKLIRTNGILDAKYSRKGLNKVIDNYFKDYKFHDSETKVMVSTYDYTNSNIQMFKSWKEEFKNLYVSEIAKLVPLAPTFFNSGNYEGNMIIDGGVAVNDMSDCLYAEMLKLYPDEDIYILNIGTGDVNSKNEKGNNNEGIAYWSTRIIPTLMTANERAVDYRMNVMLGNKYKKIQFSIPKELNDMDNPDNVLKLLNVANNWIISNKNYLKDICEELMNDGRS